MSPLYFADFSTVGTLRQVIFLVPSTTKSSSLSMARGVVGSPGVRLPGDPPPISLSDSLHRRCHVIIHSHQVASQITTTTTTTRNNNTCTRTTTTTTNNNQQQPTTTNNTQQHTTHNPQHTTHNPQPTTHNHSTQHTATHNKTTTHNNNTTTQQHNNKTTTTQQHNNTTTQQQHNNNNNNTTVWRFSGFQVQFLDKVDMPVVLQRQCFWSSQCRTLFGGSFGWSSTCTLLCK